MSKVSAFSNLDTDSRCLIVTKMSYKVIIINNKSNQLSIVRADRNLTIKGEREVSSVVERLDRGPDWLKIFINAAVALRGMRSAQPAGQLSASARSLSEVSMSWQSAAC